MRSWIWIRIVIENQFPAGRTEKFLIHGSLKMIEVPSILRDARGFVFRDPSTSYEDSRAKTLFEVWIFYAPQMFRFEIPHVHQLTSYSVKKSARTESP